jgi:prolyl oligopeptidase
MLQSYIRFVVEKKYIISIISASLIINLILIFVAVGQELNTPPFTRQDNVKEVLHGIDIVDPYRWLENQNSPETRDWINAQNKYTNDLLSNQPSRPAIKARLGELLNINQMGSLTVRGDRYFIWKKGATEELWSLYLRNGLDGHDEILLDPNNLSQDHTSSYTLGDVSDDGKILLYGIRRGGEDEIEIGLMDVDTKKDLADRLPRALYSNFSLKKDKSGFYYVTQDRDVGPRTYYHELGTDPSKDEYLFGKGLTSDKGASVFVSDDDRYLIILVEHGWAKNAIYLKNIVSNEPIVPVIENVDATFFPQYAGERLYLQTSWKAPNGRIVCIDPENLSLDKWEEIVKEQEDAIQDFSLIAGKLYVHYLHNVTSKISIYSTDGKDESEVPLLGPGSIRGPWGNWEGDNVFFEYRSYIQPRILYHYNQNINERNEWVKNDVNFDPDLYQVKQVWYPSKDGTKIPMFLVAKKELEKNGNHPTLLYGYGGFNISMTPQFSSMAALWIEQGGIYAVANIRGGGEFGEEWHKAGMLENKQNVFDDFIGAAEWLIENRYTSSSKLAIIGSSNGGLLVGSCLTQRPDLYQAVLCLFPDLDMIGYYRFDNNNPPALGEYGNASNPEHFKFLYKY